MPGQPSILEGTVEQLIPRETCLLMSSWVFQPSTGWNAMKCPRVEWQGGMKQHWIILDNRTVTTSKSPIQEIQRHATICYNCMTFISFLLYSLRYVRYVPQRTTPIFTQDPCVFIPRSCLWLFSVCGGHLIYSNIFQPWQFFVCHTQPSNPPLQPPFTFGPVTPEIEGCCDVFPFLWASTTRSSIRTRHCMKNAYPATID